MTEHPRRTIPQFYVTAPAPCPYLPGRMERKIFTHLFGGSAAQVHDALTHSGFRRSQHIVYKPACDGCQACVSVRIPVRDFRLNRTQKRILKSNEDVARIPVAPIATPEQFSVLRDYLDARHADGGMADMTGIDYATMIEESPVATTLIEYRVTRDSDGRSPLIGCTLTDQLSDGLSMVYSFYQPARSQRSLGTFMILDHVQLARSLGLEYVYLGYWVEGCRKMEYKGRFKPLEALGPHGWQVVGKHGGS